MVPETLSGKFKSFGGLGRDPFGESFHAVALDVDGNETHIWTSETTKNALSAQINALGSQASPVIVVENLFEMSITPQGRTDYQKSLQSNKLALKPA